MITLQGKRRKEGTAIAVAAVVDPQLGIGSVSPTLLESGIDALKRGLTPQDYPEAVVACESLAAGLATQIPGVRIVGIAAQSDQDVQDACVEIPCVIGIHELLKSIRADDLLVVDGAKGVVFVDPDPAALTHYQHLEEQRRARAPVFIASAHLPARTQQGETVLVYACVDDAQTLDQALDQGADGALIDVRHGKTLSEDYFSGILVSCIGKKVALLADHLPREALTALARLGVPQTMSVLFAVDGFEERVIDAMESIEAVSTEAFLQDLTLPSVWFGVLTADLHNVPASLPESVSLIAMDLRLRTEPGTDIRGLHARFPGLLGAESSAEVAAIVGGDVKAIDPAVTAGAKMIAVEPDLVGAAKHAIRCIGSEDNQ